MAKKIFTDLDVKGKRVLLRVDFNVPQDDKGNVTNAVRIESAMPTIKNLLDRGAKLILMSHLGRPKGKVDMKYTLAPVAKKFSEILGKPVNMLNDCIGPEVENAVKNMKVGDVIMLENLRFHKEEEAGEEEFARKLASLAEVFVSDAFGVVHRAHASVAGITKHLPSAAGFLLAKEIEYLSKAMENPEKPYVAILGGAKVSDKILVIDQLMNRVNSLLIGGGMAYTFLKAQGKNIGKSLLEAERLEVAKDILKNAQERGVKLLLPTDHVVADKVEAGANCKTVSGDVPENMIGLDIGPETIKAWKTVIAGAKTVIWNGPVGVFEIEAFSHGSRELAKTLAETKCTSIIGGGDTAAAIEEFGLENKMSHVSTGGGASLEFLEGKDLPGIAALSNK